MSPIGNYNPHSPIILGQEWVPIRDEDVTYSPSTNFVELGHEFTLASSTRVRDARFYINQLPAPPGLYQTTLFNVYPRGLESATGPIKSVLIPVNNGGITGGSGISFVNSSSVAQALNEPGDFRYIQNNYNAGVQTDTSMFFAVNSYPQLANKRILNVTLVYSGYACDGDTLGNSCTQPLIDSDPSTPMTLIYVSTNAVNIRSYLKFIFNNLGSLWQLSNTPNPASATSADNQIFGELNLGDINLYWDPTSVATSGPVMPWRYVDLQRFEATSANRLHIHLVTQIPSTTHGSFSNLGSIVLEYMALRVTYCEETRVAYGGLASQGAFDTNYGTNIITLRDLSLNADPVLPPGNYTLTLATVNPGDVSAGTGLNSDFPKLNGVRELYALPPHDGIRVNIPTPLQSRLGETFTKETTHVLPQLSLHTSGGPVADVHVYGRQAIAQVYGSITATQEIFDTGFGSATYPQVRYYARRFGDTTVPLRLDSPTITGSGMAVQITPDEFDLLDEIIAGWKEVTLRFDTAPTMGAGTNPQWRWSAAGELAGNRWEVLGAVAPALSGIPGNLYNLAPTASQLSTATYGQPTAGSTVNLGWVPGYAPPVTATTDDVTSDAALMFSQDMPTITGFTVTAGSQEVVGIGLDCDVDPCCVPSEILYNELTWGLPPNTGVATDLFDRVVAAGGWGTASDGKTWTTSGTAANFSVDGSAGLIIPTATASDRIAWVNVGGPDQDVKTLVKITDTAETSSLNGGLVARLTDASNYYDVEFRYDSGGTTILMLRKRVAGVATDLVSITVPTLNPNIYAWRYLRLQVFGNVLRTKVWGVDEDEPDWMLSTTDSSLTTGNNAGIFARDNTTAAAPSTFMFDDFTVRPPDYWFGNYELQRQDTVDTDWQTIMRATGPATTGFKDYEARVGVLSTYRIRGVNVYDFAGPWSSEVSITIPSPGVSGGCLDGGHVLIFTSNERQDGSINLAYSSVWLDRVQEDFTFAEAGFVQMQAMYNRDFFTAFRPTERGGEQFQRTVLVQAAAISPPTLADFTSLRDMAWEDVSYICVRDEDANRWFATVIVPSGRVTHSRKLYMAPVTVIEVTDTPSEADPS